jgi:hypothetical protein
VARVSQRDGGVRPAPAQAQPAPTRVQVTARAEGLAEVDDVVLRYRAHDDDARQGTRLLVRADDGSIGIRGLSLRGL